jgi:extracellular factor (EF) 3-hydroxypalmitic acid methyl ester biosynthesis protein
MMSTISLAVEKPFMRTNSPTLLPLNVSEIPTDVQVSTRVSTRSDNQHGLPPSSLSLLDQYLGFAHHMYAKGGPEPAEYDMLDGWFDAVAADFRRGTLTRGDLAALRAALGDAMSTSTMQGFATVKPYGYGDFEIIDSIYRCWVSDQPHLKKWDHYFHRTPAANAVRNRKNCFIERLAALQHQASSELHILNLGSGPARDVHDFFSLHPLANVRFTCVDQDPQAIDYARNLCRPYCDRIEFRQANVMRVHLMSTYDLIWSAGLFDYLSDKLFCMLLKRLYRSLSSGGTLIVGNFDAHSSRSYMEVFGDWHLYLRNPHHLRDLALRAGLEEHQVSIHSEPSGVNRFLHVSKG